MPKVVTRFAVSPTGELHVGGARTALFCYLFAKKHKGEFVLRIDDTDRTRYVDGSIDRIKEGLGWLGFSWDRTRTQSEYTEHYKKLAEGLIISGHAYRCFCTPDRLEKMKQFQEQNSLPPKYDQHCLHLSVEEIQKNIDAEIPYVIRMKIPDNEVIEFHDEIRGLIQIPSYTLDDQVLIKNDGFPTYHLANVIDDHELGTTHVIRGDEWIPSTPKHILLYRYFGWTPPQHAHLPLILRAGGGKISKRKDGDIVWIESYRKKGYHKEAFINFLASLGWNDGTDKEIFSLEELINSFDLDRIQKAGAVFNIEKLDWYSGYYIRELAQKDELEKNTFFQEWKEAMQEKYNTIPFNLVSAFRYIYAERISYIAQSFNDEFLFLFKPVAYDPKLLIFKKSSLDKTRAGLELVFNFVTNYSSVEDPQKLHDAIAIHVKEKGFDFGDCLWPWRVAVSGLDKSPNASHITAVIGKEETINRIQNALTQLSSMN